MKLGEKVLIKPLHKIVRDEDSTLIPENGKNVTLTTYHIRLARDKDIEICEKKISTKAKSETSAPGKTDKKKKSEPASEKDKTFFKKETPEA